MKKNMECMKLDRKVMVTQYAPKTFKKIREMSGVSEEDIASSLEPSINVSQI